MSSLIYWQLSLVHIAGPPRDRALTSFMRLTTLFFVHIYTIYRINRAPILYNIVTGNRTSKPMAIGNWPNITQATTILYSSIQLGTVSSVQYGRRLRWDTYCRNDPSEYGTKYITQLLYYNSYNALPGYILVNMAQSCESWKSRWRHTEITESTCSTGWFCNVCVTSSTF